MSLRRDIRDRLIAILATANITNLTVATHIPSDVQRFELPCIYVIPSASRRTIINTEQSRISATYRIVLLGAKVNLGLRAQIQDDMLDMVDEIYKVLNKAQRLQLDGSANISNVQIMNIDSDTGMVSPQAFPEGSQLSNYWAWSISVTVDYLLSAGGAYAC